MNLFVWRLKVMIANVIVIVVVMIALEHSLMMRESRLYILMWLKRVHLI